MKICLLANPRTGSTSLYGLIRAHLPLDYHSISEPFNPDYMSITNDNTNHISLIEEKSNVFLKNIYYQYPPKYENLENWYSWVIENFDKIILLDRNDRQMQAESFTYHETKKSVYWHSRQYYDMSIVDESKIKEKIKSLSEDSDRVDEYFKDYPKFFYEEIFENKDMNKINAIFEYLNLTPVQKHIESFIYSPNKKVRVFLEKRTLL
jgi:hypothetical protein